MASSTTKPKHSVGHQRRGVEAVTEPQAAMPERRWRITVMGSSHRRNEEWPKRDAGTGIGDGRHTTQTAADQAASTVHQFTGNYAGVETLAVG